ncbi:MAG: UvrB/UvrC motif-containing protein [Verrucomicrobia bacterium]|nr:UvrB/UvrC motif-containing protein [Verrucomicrobiota bacterium]
MVCDNCKQKPAEVFYSQIAEGKLLKVNLCKECSKEKGVEDPTGFALAELLQGMGENVEVSPVTGAGKAAGVGGGSSGGGEREETTSLKCPVCGFAQSDFKKTGRLGCSECYTTFAENLAPLLKQMHKGTSHSGKVPARQRRQQEMTGRMNLLRQDLVKAVRAENYEDAASLRDQIRLLEGQFDN